MSDRYAFCSLRLCPAHRFFSIPSILFSRLKKRFGGELPSFRGFVHYGILAVGVTVRTRCWMVCKRAEPWWHSRCVHFCSRHYYTTTCAAPVLQHRMCVKTIRALLKRKTTGDGIARNQG